jgi:Cytochrome c554 and c-prime
VQGDGLRSWFNSDDEYTMTRRAAYFYVFLMIPLQQVCAQGSSDSTWFKYLWYDPAKIVTGIADADRCAACHKLEYQKWETTKHATNFATLHETQRAKDISKRLGFPFIQYQSLCIKCHYTGVVRDGELQAVFGVSCQSCHGAARDWIEIHNKWGEGHTHDTETPEHKKQRIAQAKAAGMLRPSALYGVVANCFQCHTVPHEELVNKGEHPVGSSGFDLLQRINEIRHNYLHAQFDASDTANRVDPPGRRRVMYVVGRMVDLEYSIRAVAEATTEGTYSKSIIDRASNSAINLQLVG